MVQTTSQLRSSIPYFVAFYPQAQSLRSLGWGCPQHRHSVAPRLILPHSIYVQKKSIRRHRSSAVQSSFLVSPIPRLPAVGAGFPQPHRSAVPRLHPDMRSAGVIRDSEADFPLVFSLSFSHGCHPLCPHKKKRVWLDSATPAQMICGHSQRVNAGSMRILPQYSHTVIFLCMRISS